MCSDGCIDPAICPRSLQIERQRVECRLHSLQPVLPTCPFGGIDCGDRSRRKFSQRDSRYCYLFGQRIGGDVVKINDHRRVEQAARTAVSHAE